MRTSLNVPDGVLAAFDDTWQAEGIESRSRAVREAMVEYVERHRRLEELSGTTVAVVTFDYELSTVADELHRIQHEYDDVVGASSHVHHGAWCLEAVFCHGSALRIRELVYELRDFDAVGRVNVTFLERSD